MRFFSSFHQTELWWLNFLVDTLVYGVNFFWKRYVTGEVWQTFHVMQAKCCNASKMYFFCPQASCRITSEKPIIEGGVLSICSLLVSGSQQPLIEAWQHYMTVDKSREKSQLYKTLTLPRVTAAAVFTSEKMVKKAKTLAFESFLLVIIPPR